MKAWIRKWLGLKDIHHVSCELVHYFDIEDPEAKSYLNINMCSPFKENDVVTINGYNYLVESTCIKIKPLEVKDGDA